MTAASQTERRADIDPKFLQLAREIAPKNPIICDIGSRDALEGIALLGSSTAAQLHVFEANPSAAIICRQNIAKLGAQSSDRVAFSEVAVTDQVGYLKFYPVNVDQSENKDIGFSSLLPINPDYTKRRGKIVQDEVQVSATTLGAYFAGKQNPDILWVDVEGAELQVFRGAARVLKNNQPDSRGSVVPPDASREAALLGNRELRARAGLRVPQLHGNFAAASVPVSAQAPAESTVAIERGVLSTLNYFLGASPSFSSIRVPQGSVKNATFKVLEFVLGRTFSSSLIPSASSFLQNASRFFTSNPM